MYECNLRKVEDHHVQFRGYCFYDFDVAIVRLVFDEQYTFNKLSMDWIMNSTQSGNVCQKTFKTLQTDGFNGSF